MYFYLKVVPVLNLFCIFSSKDEEGKVSVNTRFADEDVWLTQAQLAEIYNTTQQNISLHQKGIYADGELEEEATHKKYLLVRQEGKRQVQREIDHYNLDMMFLVNLCVSAQIQNYQDSNTSVMLAWISTDDANAVTLLYTDKEMQKEQIAEEEDEL